MDAGYPYGSNDSATETKTTPHQIYIGYYGMYFVYVLFNTQSKKYYVWYTKNVDERLKQHVSWSNKSTIYMCQYRKLVYCEMYQHEQDARSRELKLKHHGKGIYDIKKRISHTIDDLV